MNKKGFTLIELLVVIAILGILVLLATPKFFGYAERANTARMQTDIRLVENVVSYLLTKDPELTKDWEMLTQEDISELNDSKKLLTREGEIKGDLESGLYIPIDSIPELSQITSKGEFILEEDSVYLNQTSVSGKSSSFEKETEENVDNDEAAPKYPIIHENGDIEEDGTVLHINGDITQPDGTMIKLDGTIIKPDGTVIYTNGDIEDPDGTIKKNNGDIVKPDGDIIKIEGTIIKPDGTVHYPNGDIKDLDGTVNHKDGSYTRPDGLKVHPDGSVTLKDGTFVPMATDSDFQKRSGYIQYIGTKTEVVIPEVILGTKITKTNSMFSNTSVTRVVSLNENITDMSYMFQNGSGASLDVSLLDTSNVTDMSYMFNNSRAITLNIKGLDTSKVTSMNYMFYGSFANSLDLSGFNTSNVKNMNAMFQKVFVQTLDLSSFDTSNVNSMASMFESSSATELILNSFNTSNVTTMSNMFTRSKVPVLDLSSFDFTKSKNPGLSNALSNAQTTLVYVGDEEKLNHITFGATGAPIGLKFAIKP